MMFNITSFSAITLIVMIVAIIIFNVGQSINQSINRFATLFLPAGILVYCVV